MSTRHNFKKKYELPLTAAALDKDTHTQGHIMDNFDGADETNKEGETPRQKQTVQLKEELRYGVNTNIQPPPVPRPARAMASAPRHRRPEPARATLGYSVNVTNIFTLKRLNFFNA